MEYLKILFLIWGIVTFVGTLLALFKLRRQGIDKGIMISGGISLFYALNIFIFYFLSKIEPSPSIVQFVSSNFPAWWVWTISPIGIFIVFLGQALAIWSGRTLSKNFSPRLAPITGGSLVTSGPYQICRHPIMLAILLNWLGTAMAVGSFLMFLNFGIVAILVMYRISMEERFLEKNFGDDFFTYKIRVPALIPFFIPTSPKIEQSLPPVLSKLPPL